MASQRDWLPWLLGLIFIAVRADDFQCVESTTNQPGANVPHMPTVTKDADSYQATVEVNILDKGYSYVLDEFLDYEGNRALMRVYKAGFKSSYIFSYDTDEIFSIMNDQCTVANMSDSKVGFVFGAGSPVSGDRRHVFGSASVLRFAADNHDVYNGTSEVRGIPADVYSTCITWPSVVGKARATYYFSQSNWNTSAPRQQLPLRIEVEGLSSVPSWGQGPSAPTTQPLKPRHFHHIYDFINYLPYISEDPDIFLTPPDVVCENRVVTKSFPRLGKFFSMRYEEFDPLSGNVEHRHLWYDQESKMVRIDYRYEPPGSGQYTNGMTNIVDFNTGVEYAIDNIAGCTVAAPKTTDLAVNAQQTTLDGINFFTVDMKDQNNLFYMNQNYSYVGQRKVRNILCDVFIAAVSNFSIDGTLADANFEYHFLAKTWHDVPIDASQTVEGIYPVQLVINAPTRYWTKVFNFYEFSDKRPLPSVFDVSACFDNSHRVEIQLTFPGSVDATAWSGTELRRRVHYLLAEKMQVNPVRVAGVRFSRDYQNVFVRAWVLDTVNAAQFEKLPSQTAAKAADAVYTGLKSFSACADSCVGHKDFQCNGFLFCAQDNSCRLSKLQVVTGAVVTGGSLCDAYSRTISGPLISQPSLSNAYQTLKTAVEQGKVEFTYKDSEGFEPPPLKAITVHISSGALQLDKPMPGIGPQFFYRVESVLPSIKTVDETYVWYDKGLNVFRYDTRFTSQEEITNIHDFNTGVAYAINQVTQECTVSSIGANRAPDAVHPGTGTTWALKDPLDLMYIDDSFKYIGQSTERGIPCDVFEARKTDYQDSLSNSNITNQISVFKYYFQREDWKYTSAEAMDTTKGQLVKLDIEDRTTQSFRTYNIYDFNDEHHAFSFYDTSLCFEPEQRKSFVIVFKDQPYHPTLDKYSNTFVNNALVEMGSQTFTSPARFQRASVTFDDSNVYLIVTALGIPPPLALFYKSGQVPHNASAPQELALFVDDCAATCVQSPSFVCLSFDFCDPDSDSPSCLLRGFRPSADVTSPGGSSAAASSATCTRYIRSENVTAPTVSVERVFQVLTDLVYDSMFQVTIRPPDGQAKTYVATDIRDDILRPTDPESASGSVMRQFKSIPKTQMPDSLVNVKHGGVSVTDCALLCLQENTFRCESFDYQFSLGTCRLSSVYPKQTSDGEKKDGTNVYTRLYTSEYTQYEAVLHLTGADKTVSNTSSAEACARVCTQTTEFRCEAFDVCASAKTCSLRKTHVFSGASINSTGAAASSTSSTSKADCVHYSRDHLYDYIRRDHKRVTGHDEAQADVKDVARCAYLCASGEVLSGCASFEATQVQHGNTQCVFSTVDPTNSSVGVTIEDSLAWALYTRANALPVINPTAHTGTGKSGPSTQGSGTKTCSEKSTGSNSETNIRIGIAFGTLILGALLGAAIFFIAGRIISRKYHNTEDLHGLSTWKH